MKKLYFEKIDAPYYVKELASRCTKVRPQDSFGGGNCMKNYVVLFLRKSNNTLGFDVFTAENEAAARHSFFEVYRHDDYQIVTVTIKPEARG